jgi:hypothetical protein
MELHAEKIRDDTSLQAWARLERSPLASQVPSAWAQVICRHPTNRALII